MVNFTQITVKDIAKEVKDNCLLGIPADYSGVPMSVTIEIIKNNTKGLRLYCLPLTTIQGDMLIGAGCVSEIETAAVTLGEYGQAPRFQDAIENSKIKIKDSTCPALHAQLQATEKSVPFMPLRGILGSDLCKNRNDWSVINNPMSSITKDEKIVILPAVQLDILIFHASKADINGNVQIGRRRELATLAHASKKVFVTVEEIVDEDFFDCELKAAATLPSLYVDGISLARNGAWPCGLTDCYEIDSNEMSKYAKSAKYQETFDEYMRNFISQNYYSNI
jgi:glutaconate CoA-transferase subunit A